MNCPACYINIQDQSSCECGWSLPNIDPTQSGRSTYIPRPHGITKEEFGLTLYETIATIGGILQCREMRSNPHAFIRAKAGDLKTWQLREKKLIEKLPALIQQLPDSDVAEVVRRYPWVATV